VWQWWRYGKSVAIGAIRAAVLILYGIVPTYQPQPFGRVYAAYGGVFVVLSIVWGWAVDGIGPDRFDILGGLICLIGVAVIMYWPR
jgi:small multidrug resistance family-3 protein